MTPSNKQKYQDKLKFELDSVNIQQLNSTKKWNTIKNKTQQVAAAVFGKRNKKRNPKHIKNEDIKKLSDKQKSLRNQIQSCKNKERRIQLKSERNKYINDLHKLKTQIEEEHLLYNISEIERQKDDSRRMFIALKFIQTRGKKNNIVIQHEDRLINNTTKKIEVITEYFKDCFISKNPAPLTDIVPSGRKDFF